MIEVLILEDDVRLRSALVARIQSDPEIHVRDAVGTCREALAILALHAPDVLLIDLGLPDGDGVDVIAMASRRFPTMEIMVFTVFGDEDRVLSAIRAGASGYVLKDQPGPEIREAIRDLLLGRAPISPGIARHLIRVLQAPPVGALAVSSIGILTEREREILLLTSKGYSYKECARLLDISVHTAASYMKRLYQKLAVTSRGEALFEARRLGLLNDD